ncbi:hypothetical protein VC83_07166 [Pseudogymnoascus destructans]|uniref:Protein kinase domain-containing protein n=2 Tax=Pseudogymnoascus destructans TaxID=655981 RepID=L8FN96_PSED2|nr:uncharacterized protein VC83_07166 [Pseudogymnoascus destructans]ELR02450.1 hypothetical protein GMDG_05505 [Pseudogymnoascus destructans 20631-21]OAF56604.1 hypothetical protein VC83_07166 [Pseudogymnoascus destructans]
MLANAATWPRTWNPMKKQIATLHDYFYLDVLEYRLYSESGLGLLISYIDCSNTTLEGIVCDNTPKLLRQRWAEQVTSTVRHLHEVEIVWGDAKEVNILVDINRDGWVIDFGGGFIQGCVQRENVEGDS